MPIRFYDALFCIVILLIPVLGATTELTDEDQKIAEAAQTIRSESAGMSIPQNKYLDDYTDIAREIADASARMTVPELQQKPEKPDSRVLIFASFSLGTQGLADVIKAASLYPDALVVFRGVRNENDVGDTIRELQKMAVAHDPVTNVTITPRLFKEHKVTTVPTMVYLDEEREKVIARVSGISNPNWLIQKVKDGSAGDFGVAGPVEKIGERDLTEVMQERMAGINWEQKKDEAIARVWQRFPMSSLPAVSKSSKRIMDPTVAATDDIRSPDGTLLVKRGTRANPLDNYALNEAIFVFSPGDEKQVQLVDRRLAEFRKEGKPIAFIATEFDRNKGWDSYKQITDHFDSHVFILTPDVQKRFGIERVPSVIYAQGNQIVVEELAND